jgi:hypothetical protein
MSSDDVVSSREAADRARKAFDAARVAAQELEDEARRIALVASERERTEREAAAELERRLRLRLQLEDDARRGIEAFAALADIPVLLAALEAGPDDRLYRIALWRGYLHARVLDSFDRIPAGLIDDPADSK